MASTLSQIDELNWKITGNSSAKYVDEYIKKTNWVELCQIASSLNNGIPCVLLDKTTNGLNNLVKILQFEDGTKWIARIRFRTSASDLARLRSEVQVMQFIKEKSSLPIPKVFAYETDEHNPVGVPFILMEFLPGNTGMDSGGGFDVHRGRIPRGSCRKFYRSVADCQVQMTALRFPKIGTIVKSEDGYDIGPFQDIGGPFDTAAAFFEAWAESAQFPSNEQKIRDMMKGAPTEWTEEVLESIYEFPSQIKALARDLLNHDGNNGPFPLRHADFLHSNIIVDDNFDVLGIIDWEGACTLPLQLITFPNFLKAMPRPFDSPSNYDEDGQPVDAEDKQRWQGRRDYVEMVKSAESEDNILSMCLSNEKHVSLAYCMTAFKDGKPGFYNRVVDELLKIS